MMQLNLRVVALEMGFEEICFHVNKSSNLLKFFVVNYSKAYHVSNEEQPAFNTKL